MYIHYLKGKIDLLMKIRTAGLVCLIVLFMASGGFCAVRAGTPIESSATIQTDTTLITSEISSVIVSEIYGITIEPTASSSQDVAGVPHYFPHTLSSLGNISNSITFSFATQPPGTWECKLIKDEYGNGIYDDGVDVNELDNPLLIAEEAVVKFFISVMPPTAEIVGATRVATLSAVGAVNDGSYYLGTNGEIYGGPDSAEVFDTLQVLAVGSVFDIMISREGDKSPNPVKLTWHTTPDVQTINIYYKNGTFETVAGNWSILQSGVSPHYYSDPNQVGNGINRWYKLEPSGTVLTHDMLTFEALGKFDITMMEGFNLVSLPILNATGSLQHVLGNSMVGEDTGWPDDSDIVWEWDLTTGNYAAAYLNLEPGSPFYGKWCELNSGYMGDPVESTIQISSNEGFWVQVQIGHGAQEVTIAGGIPNHDQTIKLSDNAFNLIGTNYPVAVSLLDSALGTYAHGEDTGWPDDSDIVWAWDINTGNYAAAYLNMEPGSPLYGKWCELNSGYMGDPVESTIMLTPGNGYWVKTVGTGYEWIYPKPY